MEKIFSRHNFEQMQYSKVYHFGQATDAFPRERRLNSSFIANNAGSTVFPPLLKRKEKKKHEKRQ